MINILNNSADFVHSCWQLAPAVARALHPEAIDDPASGGVLVCNQTRADRNPGVVLDPVKGLASDWAIKKTWANPSVAIAQLTVGFEAGQVQSGFEYALGLAETLPAELPQVFRDLRHHRAEYISAAAKPDLAPLYFHAIPQSALDSLGSSLPPGVTFTVFPMVDIHGQIQHVEVRMQAPGMPKEIRPYSWVSTQPDSAPHWRAKAPTVTQLFGTEKLVPGATVLFCEGPKAAAAAQVIFGNRVVTMSLASNMLGRTTFEALLKFNPSVVIWPDNDAPGYQAAVKLSAKLAAAGIAHESVTETELRDFPEKWDLADPVPNELSPAIVHDILQAAIDRLPRGPDPSLVRVNLGTVAAFPLEVLPPWVRTIVSDLANAASCPVDYVVTTLFSVVGTLMTGRYPVSPLPGFVQHPVLYFGNGGAVSMRKTPGQRAILDVLDQLQSQISAKYADDHKIWAAANKDDPAAAGDEPRFNQLTSSNATVESLMVALGGNDRRPILLAVDELDEWLTSMHKYTGGKGSGDVPLWLSLFDPRFDVVMNRASFNKGSRSTPLTIPLFGCGVVGSLQDDVLREIAAEDMARSVGMLPRLLLVRPDHRPVTPLEERPSAATLNAHQVALLDLFTRLFNTPTDQAATLVFSPSGAKVFSDWYTTADSKAGAGYLDHAGESKASGHIARLAGILHALEHTLKLGRMPPEISEQTVRNAMHLRLVYFRSHAKRLERISGEPEHERLARSLAHYIIETGATTINTIALKRDARVKGLSSNQTLLAALAELVDARWVVDRSGVLVETTLTSSRLPNITLVVHPAVHQLREVLRLKELNKALEVFHA